MLSVAIWHTMMTRWLRTPEAQEYLKALGFVRVKKESSKEKLKRIEKNRI